MEEPDLQEGLLEASAEGDDVRVRELIGAGARPGHYQDQEGYTALQTAARRGHTQVVLTLIQAGADLNIQDKDGWTALFLAVGSDHTEVVTTLISQGAHLNRRNKAGYTALNWATERGNTEAVAALIKQQSI